MDGWSWAPALQKQVPEEQPCSLHPPVPSRWHCLTAWLQGHSTRLPGSSLIHGAVRESCQYCKSLKVRSHAPALGPVYHSPLGPQTGPCPPRQGQIVAKGIEQVTVTMISPVSSCVLLQQPQILRLTVTSWGSVSEKDRRAQRDRRGGQVGMDPQLPQDPGSITGKQGPWTPAPESQCGGALGPHVPEGTEWSQGLLCQLWALGRTPFPT